MADVCYFWNRSFKFYKQVIAMFFKEGVMICIIIVFICNSSLRVSYLCFASKRLIGIWHFSNNVPVMWISYIDGSLADLFCKEALFILSQMLLDLNNAIFSSMLSEVG